jgi:uncharacterized protein YoaH (UPF0181 family)
MTVSKLGHTSAFGPPSGFGGLLARFGGGAARRAAEATQAAQAQVQAALDARAAALDAREAALDAREAAPVSRLPRAPSSSVARRPGGAADPRLKLLASAKVLRPDEPRTSSKAEVPDAPSSVAQRTAELDAAADDALAQRTRREAELTRRLPELHSAGVVVELADYLRAFARAKGDPKRFDAKLGVELGPLDLTAEGPSTTHLVVTANGLRVQMKPTDWLADEKEAWAPSASQLARGGWSVAMLESATRSALRGIEAGVTPKLREVRVGSEDRLMTNGLRPSADAAATTKALEAAFRAPVGARGRAVEKVIAERLEGLSPGEMVQVTAQMLRQIASTSQQTDAVFGRRTSDLRTHFFPHEFKAIQEAIYWAFQRNGV